MTTKETKPQLSLSDANPADVEELATVFSRSFHPTSEFMRQAQPDTPITRKWWADVHQYAIDAPNVRLMKVVRHTKDSTEIIALCRWRVYNQDSHIKSDDGDLSSGTWSLIPLSADHSAELCNAFIVFMGDTKRKYMGERPHILLELLLTVHEYQGMGAGKLLVQKLCEEADEAGLECFVETNKPVVGFYEKLGFEVKDALPMPGGLGYEEYVLVRPPKKPSVG